MSSTTLSVTEQLSLGALAAAGVAVVTATFSDDGAPLVASLGFSLVAFAATYSMIRWLGGVFMRAGLKGKDMSKPHRPEIPETMGAVCAAVYLLTLICFIPFPFYKDIVSATSGGGNRDDARTELETVDTGRFLHKFPHSKVSLWQENTGEQRLISWLACAVSGGHHVAAVGGDTRNW
jgi:UDP-N-acetylglucosamine--dolichyl-phosphate N-acetylglucosaminephosphotransferase